MCAQTIDRSRHDLVAVVVIVFVAAFSFSCLNVFFISRLSCTTSLALAPAVARSVRFADRL